MDHLIEQMSVLPQDVLRLDEESGEWPKGTAAAYATGARNLLHDLALRRHEFRDLQERLAVLWARFPWEGPREASWPPRSTSRPPCTDWRGGVPPRSPRC